LNNRLPNLSVRRRLARLKKNLTATGVQIKSELSNMVNALDRTPQAARSEWSRHPGHMNDRIVTHHRLIVHDRARRATSHTQPDDPRTSHY
jgi:hypothetical protein